MTVTAYIGLGSNLAGNLDSPQAQLVSALQHLQQLDTVVVQVVSSVYQSAALVLPDTPAQPDYFNAVVSLQTDLAAESLLDALQAIENQHQRQRQQRWAARTLDLDLLLYGDQVIDSDRLVVPHPQLHKREFVVFPLLEIAPDLALPTHGKLSDIASRLAMNGLERLGELQ